ncbi:hypothetical protein ACHAWF_011829 [Thalassiosira exigua]
MMSCPNPRCRHRFKRKLRPLVITLDPPVGHGDDDDDAGSGGGGGGLDLDCDADGDESGRRESRRARVTRMFASHPSLRRHFDPPTFVPGIPQRDLRNRMRLLIHFRTAGLVPDVEWTAIARAVDEGVDPFEYLVRTAEVVGEANPANGEGNGRRRRHREFRTESLVPLSPDRRGSSDDVALPYCAEVWRKAKTLNRDRTVLACALAHLNAMKTSVEGGYDLILEDNVRAFVGAGWDEDDKGEGGARADDERKGWGEVLDEAEWTGWSCECASRVWDAVDASGDAAEGGECHARYFGWLGSAPNLRWIYGTHSPRRGFRTSNGCASFPFPTTEDFDATTSASDLEGESDGRVETAESPPQPHLLTDDASSQTPQFATPGGTAVWGAYAYWTSPAAYHSLVERLRRDVGSLVWKGKRMRAYRAKPIDKVLPRHVAEVFGPRSVRFPEKAAFARAPMLGSLLHPQWEAGFCESTELQHRLSSSGDVESDVWDCVWLTREEGRIVRRRKEGGKWLPMEKMAEEGATCRFAPSLRSSTTTSKMVPTIALLAVVVVLLLAPSIEHSPGRLFPMSIFATAFASRTPGRNGRLRPLQMSENGDAVAVDNGGRKKAKLGKVPIVSRTIPIEIDAPSELPSRGSEACESYENGTRRLNVTVWEMDKPSDLIQEWWSVDVAERSARVGDPFGVVMWPGSILASKELMARHFSSPTSPIANATVLVLGAGTGVEAQVAASLGAAKVVATDVNPLTLKLLEHGAKCDDRMGSVEARHFDLSSEEPLPRCDIVVAADVLYNPELAMQVGRRLHEAIVRSFEEGTTPTKVIVTDSQKFHGTDFLEELGELRELNSLFRENGWEPLRWEMHKLENVEGSGVLVDEDQVYDVEVRMILWGFNW